MNQCERIKLILQENQLKQKQLAAQLGVSESYISKLLKNPDIGLSQPLASLIEEKYGYNADWIMTGEGEKKSSPTLSTAKIEFLKKIQKMPDDEITALLAFANSLETVRKSFSATDNEN